MSDEIKFKTPFGILEEEFMRPVSKGNYTPTIHEIEQLIIQKKVTYTEARILLFIKSKTIDFRDTHCRLKRKDVSAALGLDLSNTQIAIKHLVASNYLLEKPDTDHYFFFALNPITFGGTIILRSKSEVASRLNRREKMKLGLWQKTNGKKPQGLWQKAIDFMVKYHKEDMATLQNYSAFEMLKYTLLKYILLNGLQPQTGFVVIKILEETQNPDFMMVKFSGLVQSNMMHARGIVEELKRAYHNKTDWKGRPILTNAPAYVVSCWDQAKQSWNGLHHTVDMSPEVSQERTDCFEVIQTYPLQSNVVQMRRASS